MPTTEADYSRRRRKRLSGGLFLFLLEDRFERLLFVSRWIAAPIYFGLIFSLLMLLAVFMMQIPVSVAHFFHWPPPCLLGHQLAEEDVHIVVLATLTFIDIALVANLVLIVIFAGYYHFVSKIQLEDDEDWPPWMVEVDFADLKLKLFASIIALTGIELLKAFMRIRTQDIPQSQLKWLVIIHITFLFTALISAVADRLTAHLGDRSKR